MLAGPLVGVNEVAQTQLPEPVLVGGHRQEQAQLLVLDVLDYEVGVQEILSRHLSTFCNVETGKHCGDI